MDHSAQFIEVHTTKLSDGDYSENNVDLHKFYKYEHTEKLKFIFKCPNISSNEHNVWNIFCRKRRLNIVHMY